MKYLIILLLILLSIQPIYAQEPRKVLKAGVAKTWTINDARTEAFRDAKLEKDLSMFGSKDIYYNENMKAKAEKQTKIGNKLLTFFSNSSYAVSTDDSNVTYWFKGDGDLRSVGYKDFSESEGFPIKEYVYSYPSGKLQTISIYVSRRELFTFMPSGQLREHCKGGQCYDQLGNVLYTRYGVKN